MTCVCGPAHHGTAYAATAPQPGGTRHSSSYTEFPPEVGSADVLTGLGQRCLSRGQIGRVLQRFDRCGARYRYIRRDNSGESVAIRIGDVDDFALSDNVGEMARHVFERQLAHVLHGNREGQGRAALDSIGDPGLRRLGQEDELTRLFGLESEGH